MKPDEKQLREEADKFVTNADKDWFGVEEDLIDLLKRLTSDAYRAGFLDGQQDGMENAAVGAEIFYGPGAGPKEAWKAGVAIAEAIRRYMSHAKEAQGGRET